MPILCAIHLQIKRQMDPSDVDLVSETNFFLSYKPNEFLLMDTLHYPTNEFTLADVMNRRSDQMSKAQLLRKLCEANTCIADAKCQLKQLTAENVYIKEKLTKIRDNYSILEEKFKSIDPRNTTPFLKYAHDERALFRNV